MRSGSPLSLIALAFLILCAGGCSASPAEPTPTADPFSTVAQESIKARAEGEALYEAGRYREALSAFERAQLLSPTHDAALDALIQQAGAQLTPTPTLAPAESALRSTPEPVRTVATTAMPPTLPATPQATAAPQSGQAGPPTVPLPTVNPSDRPVLAPRPGPVATPLPAPSPARVPWAVTSVAVDSDPVALGVPAGTENVYVADGAGVVWLAENGQPPLKRVLAVAGPPAGIAAHADPEHLVIAVRSPPALHRLAVGTGQPVASLALPAAPADVAVDTQIGRAYVLLPALDTLMTVDLNAWQPINTAAELDLVTGLAVDPIAHVVHLGHLNGDLTTVNGTTGAPVSRVSLGDTGLSGVAVLDGRVFAINTPRHELAVYDPPSGGLTRIIVPDEPTSIATAPDQRAVVLLSAAQGSLVAHDAATLAETRRAQLANGVISAGSLAPEALWIRPRLAASSARVYAAVPDAGLLLIAAF
jgi:hypothetical protein